MFTKATQIASVHIIESFVCEVFSELQKLKCASGNHHTSQETCWGHRYALEHTLATKEENQQETADAPVSDLDWEIILVRLKSRPGPGEEWTGTLKNRTKISSSKATLRGTGFRIHFQNETKQLSWKHQSSWQWHGQSFVRHAAKERPADLGKVEPRVQSSDHLFTILS